MRIVRIYIVFFALVMAFHNSWAQGSISLSENEIPRKFHAAVESGDLNLTCSLLMSGANPNEATFLGQKPIHLAHEVKMVELLVNHGARVNSVDNYNETALLMAAFDADVNRVEYLLKNGADPNIANSNFYTPILLGLEPDDNQDRRTKIARLLLDSGADPNVRTRFTKTTPLYYAVRANNNKVVSMLIAKGAELNGNQGEEGAPLDLLHPKKNTLLFKLLVNAGAKHYELREKLLASLYEENTTTIEDILDKGIDLNFYFEEEGLSPLILAVRYLSDNNIVELFLKNGADPNLAAPKSGLSSLHSAVNYLKPLSLIESLLDGGADIEGRDNLGWTPLMHAVSFNRTEVVKLLLERGAEIDAKNKEDQTALAIAQKGNFTEAVKLISETAEIKK